MVYHKDEHVAGARKIAEGLQMHEKTIRGPIGAVKKVLSYTGTLIEAQALYCSRMGDVKQQI